MVGIFTVIIILVFSILITRVASIALTHTGLSHEASKFQARSAFTGVGFTTSESEKVVKHPVRRKILMMLMILGNAGIITGMASLIIGFTGIDDGVDAWIKVLILVAGIFFLWQLGNSKWIDRYLSKLINKGLNRYSTLNVVDFANLLNLSGEYRITELPVERNNWLYNKKLQNAKLRDEGINVIAISRKGGQFVGNPNGDTRIKDGDILIVYGRANVLQKIKMRMKGMEGNHEHQQMVGKQTKILEDEKNE